MTIMKRTLIICLAALVALASCKGPKNTSMVLLRSEICGYPAVSGHRGANCIAPENTLASADSCIKYGIDVMETDVKVSSDSVFFLLHDWTLDRTTDGSGYMYEHPASYIDSLDAGSWFGEEWAGQKVPRFQELLAKARQGGLQITVDYKDGDIDKIVDLIKEEDMLNDTYFTFSNDEDVIAFRAKYPEIRTLQAYLREPEDLDIIISTMDPDIIVCDINVLTEEIVTKCHKQRLQVLALILGLDDKTELNQKAVDLKVDVVATDRPESFRRQFNYDALGL